MKPTHVLDNDKASLKALKKALRLSSEAEVICYLIEHYNNSWQRINMLDDRQYREHVQDSKSQGVMYLTHKKTFASDLER